jgi:hypothetical protein
MESGRPQNRCLILPHNENKILVATRITVYAFSRNCAREKVASAGSATSGKQAGSTNIANFLSICSD